MTEDEMVGWHHRLNGHEFEQALGAGGQGDRYTILVNGQLTYLYFERSTNLTGNVIGRWFVERKIPREV